MSLESIVARRVSEVLDRLIDIEPVIALHGPRSVGKSTVLRQLAHEIGAEILDLDNVEVREAAIGNLSASTATRAPLLIDEYQRVPDILDAIKARLNREGSLPGTAIITGSTRQDALPVSAQALTGRLHSLPIWPLSQGEIAGERENLLEILADNAAAAVNSHPVSETTRANYVERVCAGGLPMALRRPAATRARWFDDFIRTSVERDAVELGRIRERAALADLLMFVAARTGQLLNITKAAETIGISRLTAQAHLRLLEDLFLVIRLPAWGRTLRSRVSTTPKVHVIDSGLAARLLRLTPDKLAHVDPAALTDFGHVLETFVVGEVRKQASWLDNSVALGHWRTSGGTEVDLVIEYDNGAVVAIEVKASQRATAPDFRGLSELRDLLGPRFTAGIVLTTGMRSYTYADRLHVMPIDRLWIPVHSHS